MDCFRSRLLKKKKKKKIIRFHGFILIYMCKVLKSIGRQYEMDNKKTSSLC